MAATKRAMRRLLVAALLVAALLPACVTAADDAEHERVQALNDDRVNCGGSSCHSNSTRPGGALLNGDSADIDLCPHHAGLSGNLDETGDNATSLQGRCSQNCHLDDVARFVAGTFDDCPHQGMLAPGSFEEADLTSGPKICTPCHWHE